LEALVEYGVDSVSLDVQVGKSLDSLAALAPSSTLKRLLKRSLSRTLAPMLWNMK
jgi:hypothetical protein